MGKVYLLKDGSGFKNDTDSKVKYCYEFVPKFELFETIKVILILCLF